MKDGSVNSWLASMVVGEYHYVETEYEKHVDMMHKLNPGKGKRPPEIKDRKFKTSLHTAVHNGDPTDVRYLVKVVRLQ